MSKLTSIGLDGTIFNFIWTYGNKNPDLLNNEGIIFEIYNEMDGIISKFLDWGVNFV